MVRLRLLFLCVGLLFTTTSPSLSADESAIPYIYYYANTANAIVVERADGTDSRLIAPGVMPLDSTVISDLDWSPSGQWMAWRSAISTEYYPGRYSGWIVRSDGSQRLTLLDDLDGEIINLQWSPTSDLIFVAQSVARRHIKLMIIDPTANKIIAETLYEAKDLVLRDYEINSGWLANGEEVYFGAEIYPSYLIARLTIKNHVQTTLFRSSYSFSDKYYQPEIFNLQNGRLFYFDYNETTSKLEVVLEDLLTEQRILINADSNLQTNYQVYWNPDMTYALIASSDCSTNPCISKPLSLLDWEARTLINIDPRTDTLNTEDELWRVPKIWSPDGRYLLVTETNTYNYAVLDLITKETTPLITPNGILYWEWSDANMLYLISGNSENTITYRYDIINKQMRSLPMLPHEAYYSLSPAPDGNHVGIHESQRGSVINIDTNQRFAWPPHSLGINGGIWGSYIWHPDGHWFFSLEHISFAGGGGGPEALMIVNMEGTTRRELGVCFCNVGFMPDRALPYLGEGSPTSVIQQPEYTLPHDGKVTAVAWSPDGSKLASYNLNSQNSSGGELHLWDMTGTPELLTIYQTDLFCNAHPVPCALIWSDDGQRITLTDYSNDETWDIVRGIPVDDHIRRSGYPPLSSDGETRFAVTLEGENISLIVENNDSTMTLTVDRQSSSIDSADMRPNGEYIVGASLYHPIYIWDAQTGEQLSDLNWYAIGVALTPDGARLAAAGSSLVTIWDTSEFDR